MQPRPALNARAEAWPDLIARAKQDRNAFGEIFDLYINRIYAFSMARTDERSDAEKLTTQTFEQAARRIDRYQSLGAPMSTWLFGIAASIADERARGKSRFMGIGRSAAVPAETDQPLMSPDQVVAQWERARYLRELLAALPGDQAHALRLRYFDGQDVAQIADTLQRNESATKQLLHRALENLRRRMRGEALQDV